MSELIEEAHKDDWIIEYNKTLTLEMLEYAYRKNK